MGQRSSALALGVAVVSGLCSAGSAGVVAERADTVPLVVIVHDRAQILPETLDHAQTEAVRIYGLIGVAIEWGIDPERPAAATLEQRPPAFTVQLIIQATLKAQREATAKFVMGAALKTVHDCKGTVYVFNDEVVGFSRLQRIRPGLAMGTVIAHEVGHVLLRQKGHSPKGLMRSLLDVDDWERAAMGLLWFSPDDAAIIHANTSSCRP
jgi:hypothetical protein